MPRTHPFASFLLLPVGLQWKGEIEAPTIRQREKRTASTNDACCPATKIQPTKPSRARETSACSASCALRPVHRPSPSHLHQLVSHWSPVARKVCNPLQVVEMPSFRLRDCQFIILAFVFPKTRHRARTAGMSMTNIGASYCKLTAERVLGKIH